MGEPAIPSNNDRAETRQLAASIVESVRADERMPGLDFKLFRNAFGDYVTFDIADVKELVFRLAQELELRDAEAERMRPVYDAAKRYAATMTGPYGAGDQLTREDYEEHDESVRSLVAAVVAAEVLEAQERAA